ncbi:Rieske (2Fe-2S) protein [Nocardioides humi]
MATPHVICPAEELQPGMRKLVRIGRLELGVYNVKGQIVAVRNLCPHAGAPLCHSRATGTVVSPAPTQREWAYDGEILKCPWHGWEFKLPSGETLVEPKYKVVTFPGRIENGDVVVDV